MEDTGLGFWTWPVEPGKATSETLKELREIWEKQSKITTQPPSLCLIKMVIRGERGFSFQRFPPRKTCPSPWPRSRGSDWLQVPLTVGSRFKRGFVIAVVLSTSSSHIDQCPFRLLWQASCLSFLPCYLRFFVRPRHLPKSSVHTPAANSVAGTETRNDLKTGGRFSAWLQLLWNTPPPSIWGGDNWVISYGGYNLYYTHNRYLGVRRSQ